MSPLSTLPSSPRGTGLLLPCLQKETAQAQRTQRLGLSHGTSGRVGIQGEEVWLQSLGSDPQTQQSLPYLSSSLCSSLADMFLFSTFTLIIDAGCVWERECQVLGPTGTPGENPCLCPGKKSRARQSNGRAGLFGEMHTS